MSSSLPVPQGQTSQWERRSPTSHPAGAGQPLWAMAGVGALARGWAISGATAGTLSLGTRCSDPSELKAIQHTNFYSDITQINTICSSPILLTSISLLCWIWEGIMFIIFFSLVWVRSSNDKITEFPGSKTMSDSSQSHGLQPARLLCPWNSPSKNNGVGSHSMLQGIFLIRGLNPGLLHCRQILYHLSHQGSPNKI